eukprot:g6002.t1
MLKVRALSEFIHEKESQPTVNGNWKDLIDSERDMHAESERILSARLVELTSWKERVENEVKKLFPEEEEGSDTNPNPNTNSLLSRLSSLSLQLATLQDYLSKYSSVSKISNHEKSVEYFRQLEQDVSLKVSENQKLLEENRIIKEKLEKEKEENVSHNSSSPPDIVELKEQLRQEKELTSLQCMLFRDVLSSLLNENCPITKDTSTVEDRTSETASLAQSILIHVALLKKENAEMKVELCRQRMKNEFNK